MKPHFQTIPALLLIGALLHACSAPTAAPTEIPPTATNTAIPTDIPPFIDISPSRPTSTLRPSNPTPTVTRVIETATSLARVTPLPEELILENPLSIEHLRHGNYPGSSINFEQELNPGENYRRFFVSYRSEGLKIYALMTIPNGDIPDDGWPAIIFNHGYIAPDVYKTTERYVEYVDALAKSGYIVFRPDYRGHDLSEGEARGAYGYPDYTIDVLNALASVKGYPDVDPGAIGMWGHSMGGYLTLRCMVISKDIKAGVIWAGVVAPYIDMVYNWPGQTYESPDSANSWRITLSATYGSPTENPAFWDAISANSYVTELSGPLQLHHGTADAEVPVAFSINLYQRLLDAGMPVELYTYANDNHNISNSFDLAMKRTIEFFDAYLK